MNLNEIGQVSSFSIYEAPCLYNFIYVYPPFPPLPQLSMWGHGSKAYLADAIAALIGSMLGVSTVATFAESTAGVADGAKTGPDDG